MTDADLLTLIRSTPALRAFADAGADAALAAAVPALAPPVVTPRPFTAADIMGAVSPASIAKVATSAMYFGIQTSVQAQDRAAVAGEAQLCVLAGLISPAEQAAINAVLAATVSTPDTSVTHQQVSRVLNAIRPVVDGTPRAAPIAW